MEKEEVVMAKVDEEAVVELCRGEGGGGGGGDGGGTLLIVILYL